MNKGDLINNVYQADLSKRATLVVFYLINRADKEMTCFPGIKTIAKECNISVRTVQRALNDLVDAGFVNKESRYHEQGGQRSNLYILKFEVNKADDCEEMTFASYNDSVLMGDGENITEDSEELPSISDDIIEANTEMNQKNFARNTPIYLQKQFSVMEGWSG